MTTKTVRNIIHIDEKKCNGCGACATKCVEGAIKMIDGKAKLVSDVYCDGLGACIRECPVDAITIEKREAEAFDEKAVEQHLHETLHAHEEKLPCGCPGSAVQEFQCPSSKVTEFQQPAHRAHSRQPSTLGHWPVQLTLVPPQAPFLKNADVVLTADCVPFAYANFHQDFLKGNALLVACPKLDDAEAHLNKLTQIIAQSGLKSLTVIRMEVPCCSGLVRIAQQAIAKSGKNIPFEEVVVSIRGEITA
jgi:Pyruvate/2-oxoacid:ferredoxin oxidoreductase delta subunit